MTTVSMCRMYQYNPSPPTIKEYLQAEAAFKNLFQITNK